MKLKKGKFFRRGIHPHDMKYLSCECPIETMTPPESIAISLQQHIGKPAECVVQVGDHVKVGQLIGKQCGPISANVYASVSGEVTAIRSCPNPRGGMSDYVVIQNDGTDESVSLPAIDAEDPAQILDRIHEAGIVGMGGAGFPTAVKLAPRTPVDTLIINGAECEPYLTCDYRLMIERTQAVLRGIRLLAKALGVTNIMVGIEANKPKAIELFAAAEDMQVVVLKKRYPMGSEKHLIYCCTGRKVRPGQLPADAGCVVQNIATAYAVYEAVDCNKPLYERIVTISGQAVQTPKNLQVRFGTSFGALLDAAGMSEEDTAMLIAGGPMMGATVLHADYYTRKTDSGLLALKRSEVGLSNPTACINCGKCASVCPMHLLPMRIDFYTIAGDYTTANEIGGVMNCIECGSCAYVCPANRALLQSITLCKSKLRAMK